MNLITVKPSGKEIHPEDGLTFLDLCRKNDVPLASGCSGRMKCGKCKVVVEQSSALLPPPSEKEKRTLGAFLDLGYRLACALVLKDPAVIRIPEEPSPVDRIMAAGAGVLRSVHPRPAVRGCCIELKAYASKEAENERDRLFSAVKERYGISLCYAGPHVLKTLSGIIRSGERQIWAAILKNKEVISLRRGKDHASFGVAFDIGTTTVVGYLMDLERAREISVRSSLNPQIRFGDDIISRISYCKKDAGAVERLRSLIVECLNTLIYEMAQDAGINSSDIVDAAVAGNSVMHHLLLGLDPWGLSIAPYLPVVTDAQDFRACDMGLSIAPSACVHFMPLKAGFLGSDAIAGTIATSINKRKKPCLLIDIGTNGEIVLGDRTGILCCSAAAGPAFEGGHISHGIRAVTGAIEKVTIDPNSWDVGVTTIGGVPPAGICGSGVISAVAEMVKAGIITAGGGFTKESRSPRLRSGSTGHEFILVNAADSSCGKDIVITHRDVSQVQMAKAAIHAGASILWKMSGEPDMKTIFLAGAGGSAIDAEDAKAVGLIPEFGNVHVVQVGNAAGRGACLALASTWVRKEAASLAKKMKYVELSGLPLFQDMFISSMPFKQAKDADEYC